MAHTVQLEEPFSGRLKIVKMAVSVVTECLMDVPRNRWSEIPLLLCLSERDRPGRIDGLDDEVFSEIQDEIGAEFSKDSLVIPHGRVSVGAALKIARKLLDGALAPFVLVAAADSLLNLQTLSAYERDQRLLTAENSNGFMPGEGAAALLLSPPSNGMQLQCIGLGSSFETATIASEEPLRATGLVNAIAEAVADAGCDMSDIDFRITDITGEQYYFKEAALALTRLMRVRKDEFDIWHPAECIGDIGAAGGLAMLIVADAACRKGYAKGPVILCHASADSGQRSAILLRWQSG